MTPVFIVMVLVILALQVFGYAKGRKQNRVLAIGRDTYWRFFPNPGCGISFGSRRFALSWKGGFEVFAKDPVLIWRRKFSVFSRIQRPGEIK